MYIIYTYMYIFNHIFGCIHLDAFSSETFGELFISQAMPITQSVFQPVRQLIGGAQEISAVTFCLM